MSKLEDLRPNASIEGILPNCLVTVVSAQWFGWEVLDKLTYKNSGGKAAYGVLPISNAKIVEVQRFR
jgi:hypothetical protein